MPIYEYKATEGGCGFCRSGFEIIQRMHDEPLNRCPRCRAAVRKLPSRFRACVSETPDGMGQSERRVRDFEKEGMWSHAAELADKAGLEDRAKEDYKKAGWEM